MPNVNDDDEESLDFADESEWMEDGRLPSYSGSQHEYVQPASGMDMEIQEAWITRLAELLHIDPASVHGFVVIVHTHPDSGQCGSHMEAATNVRPGMARTIAISYAEQQAGKE
jgi:hypothetical protein